MATLKEIKTRIQSVKSTQKITSAMKMVSSAKLRKAEKKLENSVAYVTSMQQLRSVLLHDARGYISPLAVARPLKKVLLVVFSGNSGMCGSFNANIIKQMSAIMADYEVEGVQVSVVTVGKKVSQACAKLDISPEADYSSLIDKPEVSLVDELAEFLIHKFLTFESDRVELVFHNYQSKANQQLTTEVLLPCEAITLEDHYHIHHSTDYLYDSDKKDILDALVPALLKTELFHALLSSHVSEHAARTTAMQTATDNASDLLQELSLQYNKSRQQAITAELLDIMGGSFK